MMDHPVSTYSNNEARDGRCYIPPAPPSYSNASGFLAQDLRLCNSCQQPQNMHRSHMPSSSFATQGQLAAPGGYLTQATSSTPSAFGSRPVRKANTGPNKAPERYYELQQLLRRVLESCDEMRKQNCELKRDITALHREYVYLTH